MEVNVINIESQNIGKIDLNPLIFSVNYRPDILKMVVEWQLSKRRIGAHKTKTIGDVSGTTAKPYRQKHTGRARQGSLRSPQFRGGAVIFGPVVRTHAYSLNKKVRNLGLKVALSLKNSCNKLLILDSIDVNFVKTAQVLRFIKNFEHQSFLIISKDYNKGMMYSCKNLHNVTLLKQIGTNVFDILRHDCVILTVDTVKYLEDRLL
ncbi:50S ribosomal protein L4 [Ehrlichia ruminantium]|uniref:50S ribosomal protein L4 n=1 Tax=Ehrlichia ruminantium TaxID=779 RepID=UPI0007C11D8C|nr:50S ribosomal protein L4 [Ehrlichia ruminantium]QLK52535.1 50S ribosomal protein L4 [Ehrlichia ruminantium]QLK54365.1 50S ribosomal protein L4 [Ehrlichia ruminantium]QLK57117.1 50S ribosomal protein L4 [Ehrlichia ruminantium]GAT76456.1 50S ribosomal protein L4 [Ehrlichia ruminantium]